MIPTTRHSDLTRVLDTHSAVSGALSTPALALTVPAQTGAGLIVLGGYRGVPELSFFGTGADNATASYTIDAIDRWLKRGDVSEPTAQYEYECWRFSSGTFALSTLVGVANGVVGSSDRVADTLTHVLTTRAKNRVKWFNPTVDFSGNGWDTAAQHSPADNTRAFIAMPDLANIWGLYFQFTTNGGGTATGMNALINLGT